VLTAGRECAVAFKALLELIHQVVLKPTYDKKQKLPAFSKEVATCVGEVVQAAEVLKGGCVSYLDQSQGLTSLSVTPTRILPACDDYITMARCFFSQSKPAAVLKIQFNVNDSYCF